MRYRLLLALVVTLDLSGLAVLHGLAARPWARLDPSAPAEDAVFAVLRLFALGFGWWIAGSTLLCAVSRLGGRAPVLARGVARLTLPGLRRLVEAALVASLSVGRLAPAAAEQAIPPLLLIERDTGSDHVLPPGVGPPADHVAVPEPRPRARLRGADRHVVQRGEHLWAIAAATVGDATPHEVASYWRRLVEANRRRLRSGDPDLVLPGEVLHLPPP